MCLFYMTDDRNFYVTRKECYHDEEIFVKSWFKARPDTCKGVYFRTDRCAIVVTRIHICFIMATSRWSLFGDTEAKSKRATSANLQTPGLCTFPESLRVMRTVHINYSSSPQALKLIFCRFPDSISLQ